MAGKRCEYPFPSYLSLSCSGWIFLFESVVNSTHPSAKSNIYVSSANPLPFSILSSVHENFLCTVSPGILPDLSLPWTSIRKRRVILRNKTAMNIQIMRSVQRCRKAWESRMLQRFVYPLGLLWARPNCPLSSSSPQCEAPNIQGLSCVWGCRQPSWSLPLSLLNSQIRLLFTILISKFSEFLLLKMIDSKQQSSYF